jgi:hypothetical protein
MTVNLQLGHWLGYRLDKDASSKVTKDALAAEDAARVNKHLVPKESLKDVVSAAGAIRHHFYEKSLPWKDNGDRVITRKLYMDFINEHGVLVEKFNEAVTDFLHNKYPAARDQAMFRMGSLWKPDDYPAIYELKHKFYVNLDVEEVADALDARLQPDNSKRDARLQKAMADVWDRLSKVVGHFLEKTSDEEAAFRDSLVTNISDLVDILPALNVIGDPRLDELAAEVKQRLCGYEPKDLRKKPEVRSAAAQEAAEIMETMKGFMAAFSAGDDE